MSPRQAKQSVDLDALLRQRDEAARNQAALDRQIREARAASATKVYDQVVELLRDNASFFSLAQRNHIARVLASDNTGTGKLTAKGNTKLGPKFQLPTGETWTGHGKRNKAFDPWARSAAGKAWRSANPGQQWPSYPNTQSTSAPAKVAKKTAATKKTAKKKSVAKKRPGKRK